MADAQGAASIYVRNQKALVSASSILLGSTDSKGVWRGMRFHDPISHEALLNLDESDEQLGAALRAALTRSRINVAKTDASVTSAAIFEDHLAGSFGLNSARSLFAGMRHAYADWFHEDVTLSPSRRDGKGGFEGQSERENIVIPWRVDDAEFGASLRECIRRSS